MKTGYNVIDAMTKRPIFVGPETTLQECAKIMAKKHVGGLIIKENNVLKGIMTEQDVVRKIIAKGKDPRNVPVREVMETKITTIKPDKDIFDAIIMMRDKNIRHLPVMDNEKMLGLLTMKDVLKIEPQLFDLLIEKFELREEENKPIHNIGENEGVCETCGEYFPKLYEVDGSMMCFKCAKG